MTVGRALVTGATGFVGRAIAAELFQRGWTVRGASRVRTLGPWQEFFECDVRSRDGWPMDNVDVIVHAAGLAHDTRGTLASNADYEAVNAQGTANAAAASARAGCSALVIISSVKAMADRTTRFPMTEGDTCRPTTAYGVSKLRGEQLAAAVLEHSACKLATVRLTPVYGTGNRGNLERLLRVARKRWTPLLPPNGGERSMVHAHDVGSLIAAVIERKASGIFIAEDGLRYTPRSIQEHVRASLGLPIQRLEFPAFPLRFASAMLSHANRLAVLDPLLVDMQRFVERAVFDGTKGSRAVGWHPEHTLWQEMPELLIDG